MRYKYPCTLGILGWYLITRLRECTFDTPFSEMVFVFRKKYPGAKNQQLQSIPYDSLLGSDQPQDLWDRAHRLLREDKSKKQLLVAYERILLSELDKDVPPITFVDWGSRDRTRQVSRLIEEKLKALKESSWRLQLGKQTVEIKSQIEKIIKTVLWGAIFRVLGNQRRTACCVSMGWCFIPIAIASEPYISR